MTTTTQKINRDVFEQAQQMLDSATQQGPAAIDTHLRALAFSLGAQAAVVSDPMVMPDVINDLITEFSRGIQTVMQEAYGVRPQMDVEVHAVTAKKH